MPSNILINEYPILQINKTKRLALITIPNNYPLYNTDVFVLKREIENIKPNHKLRSKYFLLIQYAWTLDNRLDIILDEDIEAMSLLVKSLDGCPNQLSYQKNILGVYRLFIEKAIGHKQGVSDKNIDNKTLSTLYEDLYQYMTLSGLDLKDFEYYNMD